MKKLKELFSNAKQAAVIGTGTALVVVANSSFAADGDIDTAKALLYIAGGLAAAGVVGGAMFGLVALIGSIRQARRAGT